MFVGQLGLCHGGHFGIVASICVFIFRRTPVSDAYSTPRVPLDEAATQLFEGPVVSHVDVLKMHQGTELHPVFNLRVSQPHNFVAAGVVVHNK